WQHQQTKHLDPIRQVIVTTTTKPVQSPEVRLEDLPDIFTPIDFNQTLQTNFKINAIQALINQLDHYEQAVNDIRIDLTDPNPPLGELGEKYKKKPRRNVPAYLNLIT